VLEIFKTLHISTSYGERKVRFIRSQRKRRGGGEREREREREREEKKRKERTVFFSIY